MLAANNNATTYARAAAVRRAAGQGMLEFALILPLLLLFALGVIEAGRMLAIYSSLSSAAKQAARYGSVAGDSDALTAGEQSFYEDCDGMRAAALRSSILVGLEADDIAIGYDRGTSLEPIGQCTLGNPTPTLSESIRDGYRVVITITAVYRPLVPIVPLPDMPMTFAAARTIFTTIIGPTNTPLPFPDVYIRKAGMPVIVGPNADLTYWITATNHITSGVLAHNLVITDTLPVSVTLTADDLEDIADDYEWNCTFVVQSPPPQQIACTRLAPLPAGQSSSFSYSVRTPLYGGVVLTNTVGVSMSDTDLQPADNVTRTVHTVLAGADLQPHKIVTPTSEIGGGTTLTYTLWVHNNGSEESDTRASSGDYIWMTDTLPSGLLPYRSLTTGSGWVCTTLYLPDRLSCRYSDDLAPSVSTPRVTLVLTAPATARTLTNTLVVTPSRLTADPLLNNNAITVTSLVVTNADLAVTKLGATSANGGESLLYTLRVQNAGPSVATNVRLTDVIPGTITNVTAGAGWSCESPVVANTLKCVRAAPLHVNATTADITVSITVPNHDITNTAVVGADMPDPNTTNNSATVATSVRVCNSGRTADANSSVLAAPAQVQANGTSVSQVTVTLLDLCMQPATHSQTVTLTSSRGSQDTITLLPGSSNPTTTGQVIFRVVSAVPGSSLYSASVQNHVAGETVNLTSTANVTYYGCVTVTGQRNQASTQTYVDFRLSNATGRAWKLTVASMDWPSGGSRKINQVVMNTTPATTLWSGNSNRDPFSLPGSAAWNSGTDAARTIADGVAGQSLLYEFNFATPGQTFVLAATWDDGNGYTCTTSTTVTP